jgi:hypothetical protein
MKNKKILISHEVPFCLLEKSLDFCDYQYALPHLLESNEEYRNHFLKCKEKGIEIYLDNSLHELGYSMDADVLLKWINILQPSNFFVPDVWENYAESVRNAKQWSKVQLPEGVTKVAVVQAKSVYEAGLCVQAYRDFGYKKIAFSYGADYYHSEMCPHPNKDLGKAIGRFMVISQFMQNKTLLPNDRVHLLGTASPIEFGMYKGIPCIESIDTSNPVMASIEGGVYTNMGLGKKPIANMNNYQNIPIDEISEVVLNYNIKMFRQINGL